MRLCTYRRPELGPHLLMRTLARHLDAATHHPSKPASVMLLPSKHGPILCKIQLQHAERRDLEAEMPHTHPVRQVIVSQSSTMYLLRDMHNLQPLAGSATCLRARRLSQTRCRH